MSNYFNEAGEPLMDGAAMRYEMYLDSTYEPDPYDDYDSWDNEPEEIDPAVCTHGNVDYSDGGRTAECQDCFTVALVVVYTDFNETEVEDFIAWPNFPESDEGPVMEDQWLDGYMEDRLSTMYC